MTVMNQQTSTQQSALSDIALWYHKFEVLHHCRQELLHFCVLYKLSTLQGSCFGKIQ